eukprot:6163185-Pyramimonas_sp.AAC.1
MFRHSPSWIPPQLPRSSLEGARCARAHAIWAQPSPSVPPERHRPGALVVGAARCAPASAAGGAARAGCSRGGPERGRGRGHPRAPVRVPGRGAGGEGSGPDLP